MATASIDNSNKIELKRYGTVYGGFYYPKDLDGLDEHSIIYCVGAGEDISHDIEIAKKLGSQVHIFDPTPRAIEHVKYIKEIFENKAEVKNNTRFGGGNLNYLNIIMNNKVESSKINIYEYGLHTEDEEIKFYKPTNTEFVSHSVVKGMKGDDYINVKVKKLKTIMKELNHDKIDLLKIDIEGTECDVLTQMLEEKIYPKYLSVDFDLGWTGEKIKDLPKCKQMIMSLINNGYKVLHNSNADFSFVRL